MLAAIERRQGGPACQPSSSRRAPLGSSRSVAPPAARSAPTATARRAGRRAVLARSSGADGGGKNQFDVDNAPAPAPLDAGAPADLGPREDDALPNSLADAMLDAAAATAAAIARGATRCQVRAPRPAAARRRCRFARK